MRARALFPLLALLGGAYAGCGSKDAGPDFDLRTPPPYIGALPVAPPGQRAVDRKMTRGDAERFRPVIADWAAAVRRGDAATAAGFFDLPAIVYRPGHEPLEVRTPLIAEAFNASLPCGARLLGTNPEGRYVIATFVLVKRGQPCADTGDLARVGFVFGDRRHRRQFTEWWEIRTAPDSEPGPAARPKVAQPATVADFG